METVAYTNTYGAIETNGLVNGLAYHKHFAETEHPTSPLVDWTAKGLKITRLRLLTDIGCPFWDVSYCYGTYEGYSVRVQLPFNQLARRNLAKQIISYAKADGVFAKGLGILDCISCLK